MRYLILIPLLAGCTATNWTHPNKTEAQFNADKYDCQQTATQYAANLGFNGNPMIVRDQYAKCMQQKHGYTPVKGAPVQQEQAVAQKPAEPKLPVTSDF